ncbi:MAG TPA: CvpA family protein [Verrucomicrobiae bacterium]|nr:CvpA family protein [Verrucomicrobiae bacterium]
MDNLQLPFGWFDIAVLLVMLAGFMRGRRNGMSVELLDMMKWLAIVVLGSLYYRPIGDWLARCVSVTHNYADLLVYVFIILAVLTGFAALKRLAGGKLVSRETFGRMDARLGMLAGVVHYLCCVLVAIVIINTPLYGPKELSRPLSRLQQQVIYSSATGLFVREYFRVSLIEPVPETPSTSTSVTMAKRQEQEVDDAMGHH